MVNKTTCVLSSLLILLPAIGCAKQQSTEAANESQTTAQMCKTFIEEIDKEKFRDAYNPLLDKQDLLILVDEDHSLSSDYVPPDLVGTGKERLRAETYTWMKKMQKAAAKDGVTLFPVSGYRSYNYQKMLTKRTQNPDYVALPGHSQHQLGTAIDFNTVDPADENIPALKWLRKHAGEYGFSLSFPKGAEAETGYPYEAWHYRYITREGVYLQDHFFGGSQHKTLTFLHWCLWLPNEIENTEQNIKDNLFALTEKSSATKEKENRSASKK